MKLKLFLIAIFYICSMHVYSQTTVFINPPTQTVGSGQVFTTTVEITQVSDLGAWEFEVSFDPTLVQANSISVGSFIGSTGNTVIPIASNIDNVNGLIESAVSSFGANPGASGNGVILNIEWISNSSVTTTTTTDLILQNEQFLEKDATIIPTTIQNGSVTITGLLNTSIVSTATCPGIVTIPIEVSNFDDVIDFNLSLDYISTELTYSTFQNVNTSLTGVAVINAGSELLISYSGNAVTIGNGTLLELVFSAPSEFTQTVSSLSWDQPNCTYTDQGGIITATYNDGTATINPIPVDAGAITGTTPVCQGTNGEGYHVSAITNATSYVWELSPITAGTINGSGTNITIDYSATYSGSATLSVYGSNICGDGLESTLAIDVIANPTADAGIDAVICENGNYGLSGTATSYQSAIWSSPGDGSFDDATSFNAVYTPGANDIIAGSVSLTLTANAITPCATNASDDMVLYIALLATSNAGSDATICEENTHQLAGTSENYSFVEWLTSGDGSFDDQTILTPIYTPGANDIVNGTVVLTLEATAGTPCMLPITDNMTLTIQELPTADAGADDAVCETTPVYTLSGTASNHTSVLWTGGDGTFDNATLLNATYTAGPSDLSAGSVTLTLTAYPNAPCATNAVDDMLLTFAVLPTANAGPDDEICLNTPSYQITGATAIDYTTLLWTTSGDGTFDDATLLNPIYSPGTTDRANGTVDLTLTATSVPPCTDDDTMTLTFAVLPTANAGADAEICEDDTYQLSGTATDYSALEWTTSGDGSFDDVTSLTAIYTPGATDKTTGSVNLTLTAFASFPCVDDDDDTMVLSIGLLPIADAGPDDEICLNTPSYYIANASASNQSSVLWTTAGDGTFDDPTLVNATYTPGTNDIANFSVVLTITAYAATPCTSDDVDDMLLEFALLPTADAGVDDDVCETDSYTLSGSYTNGSSCLWTSSGDGTFDDATLTNATYTPGTNDIANGTVDLTITAYAQFPCTNDAVDVMILTIILQPSVDAGIDDAICENTVSFATAGTTSGDISSVLWETTGDGTFDDPTILASTYSPGPNDITNEGVDLILNAYPTAPCTLSVSDTMFLLIQPLPTSNAGDDDEVCENDSYMLSGSGTNFDYVYWTTSGDGTYDDGFLLNATYTPGTGDIAAGSVELTMHAYSINPCSGEANDVMILTIIDMPDVNAGDDGETCEGSSYLLNGVADNYSSINWATSGDGTFDDPALLAATYTPGTVDISNGTIDLTLTASPVSPCSSDVSDDMTLSIVYPPEQPLTPDGPIAIDLDATQTSEYTTEVTNTTSCQWYLEPVEAGTIDGTDIIGTVYWSSDYVGISAYIHVVAVNDCGEATSDTLGVSVSPVGIVNPSGNELQIYISPNPSLGKFNITIEGATDDINLIIINSSGQPIHREKLINTTDKYVHMIDIRPRLSGIYYLKFVTKNAVSVRKVLIK